MGTDNGEAFQHAWRTYFETSLLLETRLEEDLRSNTGLSLAEYNALLLLSEAPNCRTRMGRLADRMVFSPSRLTYQIKSMERRGLVLRQSAPEDKRVHDVVLTAVGLQQFRAAAQHHAMTVHALFEGVTTEEDLAVIERVFSQLRAKLSPVDRPEEG